jgi:hypothetical protein
VDYSLKYQYRNRFSSGLQEMTGIGSLESHIAKTKRATFWTSGVSNAIPNDIAAPYSYDMWDVYGCKTFTGRSSNTW